MVTIKSARYLSGYQIALEFDNGEAGVVDLSDVIRDFSAASALRDPAMFQSFTLDDWPTLVWPNGFDLSPEMLYERAIGKPIPWLHNDSSREMKQQSHA